MTLTDSGVDCRRFVTFDCFDTVMTRATGGPRSVGYVVAERLRAEGVLGDAGRFANEVIVEAREEAERLAYLDHGEGRALRHAARQFVDLLDLDPALVDEVVRIETEVELAVIRPVPAVLERIAREREQGAHIGFLSDTGLSAGTVRAMLQRCGAIGPDDPLWVSNELGAEKGSGRAYPAVGQRLERQPVDWSHHGDNEHSDVRMARFSGLSATCVTMAQLNRYERRFDAAGPSSGGFAPFLGGAARRARLVDPTVAGERNAALTGVAAPLLVGFALWTLRAATRAGVCRLACSGGRAELTASVLRSLAAALSMPIEVTMEADGARHGPPIVSGQDRGATGTTTAIEWGLWQLADPAAGPGGPARGYLVDQVAETGARHLAGEIHAAVAVLLAEPTVGDDPLPAAVSAMVTELTPLLTLLDPGADVRAPIVEALLKWWRTPTPAEASAWRSACPEAFAGWDAGRVAVGPAAARLVLRVQRPATRVRHKASRLAVVLSGRRTLTRSLRRT